MTKTYRRIAPSNNVLWILFAGLLTVGCAEDSGDDGAGDDNTGDDGASDGDADNGASISVQADQDGDQETCSDDLAEDIFRFSLCSCYDAVSMGVLTTGSFDSLIDRFTLSDLDFDDFGAAVGVNHDLSVPGVLSVGGSAFLAGPNGVALPGLTTVQGDLKVDGNVSFAGVLNVARDLVAGKDFVNFGDGNIVRDLYLGGIMALPFLTVPGGSIISESVEVPPPCACDPEDILDIAGIVEDARNDNQNDVIAIHENSLLAIVGYRDLELPPGRYYFTNIAGAGKLTLKVTGHTALFIEGDMLLAGDLEIETDDDATLDVFIAGDFQIAGANDFGSIARPAAVRFYVAGSNDVTLTGYTAFVGNLYAPNANVILTGASYIFGAIFAGNFLAMGDTGIYYDRSINQSGDDCEDDGDDDGDDDTDEDTEDTCIRYGDDCVVDADCCEPLVCTDGECRELDVPLV